MAKEIRRMTPEEKEEFRQIIREEIARLNREWQIGPPYPKHDGTIPDGQCPPSIGGCPTMFLYIPAGQSVVCHSCGRTINSTSPTFSTLQ